MKISVNPVVIKKLLLVKQIYQQALALAKIRHSEVGRITSVILFDLSVETMLKTIMLELDHKIEPDRSFGSLIQSAESLMTGAGLGELPDKVQIRHSHSIRNDAQHKASYPSESEVNECGIYAKAFLQNVTLQIWNVDFDKLSMLEVIQHPKIREFLTKAQNGLSDNDWWTTLAYAKLGLQKAVDMASKAFFRLGYYDLESDFVVSKNDKTFVNDNLMTAFKNAKELLTFYALGINHIEYLQFRSISGNVLVSIAADENTVSIRTKSSISPSSEDIEFAVNYSINTVAQIESLVGDLESPFGVNNK